MIFMATLKFTTSLNYIQVGLKGNFKNSFNYFIFPHSDMPSYEQYQRDNFFFNIQLLVSDRNRTNITS